MFELMTFSSAEDVANSAARQWLQRLAARQTGAEMERRPARPGRAALLSVPSPVGLHRARTSSGRTAHDGEMSREWNGACDLRGISRAEPGAPYCAALSGGRIARLFYSSLVEEIRGGNGNLAGVHFFWADERCVPPDDPESNFKLAQDLLFSPLAIPASQIHRIAGENAPAVAAAEAAKELRRFAAARLGDQPVLDMVFLGLGEDGHVASLFPGESATTMKDPAVYRPVLNSPKPPSYRVTLGYPALAAAREVWVLVSGPGKAAALRDSLSPTGATPLARLMKMRPDIRILSDFPV